MTPSRVSIYRWPDRNQRVRKLLWVQPAGPGADFGRIRRGEEPFRAGRDPGGRPGFVGILCGSGPAQIMFTARLAIFFFINLTKCETHLRYPIHGSGQWQVVAPRLAGAWDQDQFSLLLLVIHTVKTNFSFPGGRIEWALLTTAAEKQHRSKDPSANRKPRDTNPDHFIAKYVISRRFVIAVD